MFVSVGRNEQLRMVGIGILALLEGVVMLSVVTRAQFVPNISIYPNVVSLLVVLLPILVGFLARRWEAAIVTALLPLLVGTLVYLARLAPAWYTDLFTLGIEIERVAGSIVLVGALGFFGWLLRRAVLGAEATGLRK